MEDEDESIIARKLIFDSSMEESYINLLQKMIVKWIVTDYKSVNDSEAIYNNISHQLCRVNMFRKKSEIARRCNMEDIDFIKSVQRTMEGQVSSVTNTIESTRHLLKDAQKEGMRSAKLRSLIEDISEYLPLDDLLMKKKKLEEQQLKAMQMVERISSLEQQLENQTQSWMKSYEHCTEEIEKM